LEERMMIVTGASGQLGRAVVEKLLERVPATQIGVSVRDPEKARDLEARGVRVRHGDFDDANSLPHAFEGATQVLIISSNTGGGNVAEQHKRAIDAAKDVGAKRILYTSHMGSNAASAFPPMRGHAATEALLQSSGVAFTSLRNGFYADSGLMLLGQSSETGELVAPEDGPVSWTTHADLAEATAIILTEEGRFDGITPALTASEALDLADLAARASEVVGRPIRRIVVSDEEQRTNMLKRGLPAGREEMVIAMSLGLAVASRNGEFRAVDPTLGVILGRAPITMRDFLASKLTRKT
jgi:NAD(P)H dehydrogenase (quinone)